MITEEMKEKIYNFYCVSYLDAVAEVIGNRDITEATQEESLKIIDILCDKMQNNNEFSEADIQELILNKFIEGCVNED